MTKADRILELIRNKTKRVNLAFNPKLWAKLEALADNEGVTPTNKIEDLIINYLESQDKL